MRDGACRGNHADLHGDGVGEDAAGQLADLVGHGGREEEGLALRWHELQDAADVGQEAHVAHAVGFVQHQDLDVSQVDAAVTGQVQQATRAGDDDLGAAPQRFDLVVFAHAAVDGNAAHPGPLAQVGGDLVDLLGQLARGRQDQGTDAAGWALDQPLQDGQDEGRGLAGAGLCRRQDVVPLQHAWDRLLLDGGRHGIAGRLDARADARVK